jgi:hypothetical protein
MLDRQANGAEAGLLQTADCLVRQIAAQIALGRPGGDLRENRSERCGQCLIVLTGAGTPGIVCLRHAFSTRRCRERTKRPATLGIDGESNGCKL